MIIFEGPSLINGEPIVCLATVDQNPKTGRMLGTSIIRQDQPPEVAAYNGADEAICGNCKYRAQPKLDAHPERPAETRTCYVRLTDDTADEVQSEAALYRRYKAGDFDSVVDVIGGRWEVSHSANWQWRGPEPVRIGRYGDPAAVSYDVWADLVELAPGWTGYTHLWADCDQRLRRLCMASVDTVEEWRKAEAMGWRVFLVVPEGAKRRFGTSCGDLSTLVPWEDHPPRKLLLCPATRQKERAAKPITCADCLLCDGTNRKAKSIWEKIHGANLENMAWTT